MGVSVSSLIVHVPDNVFLHSMRKGRTHLLVSICPFLSLIYRSLPHVRFYLAPRLTLHSVIHCHTVFFFRLLHTSMHECIACVVLPSKRCGVLPDRN